ALDHAPDHVGGVLRRGRPGGLEQVLPLAALGGGLLGGVGGLVAALALVGLPLGGLPLPLGLGLRLRLPCVGLAGVLPGTGLVPPLLVVRLPLGGLPLPLGVGLLLGHPGLLVGLRLGLGARLPLGGVGGLAGGPLGGLPLILRIGQGLPLLPGGLLLLPGLGLRRLRRLGDADLLPLLVLMHQLGHLLGHGVAGQRGV